MLLISGTEGKGKKESGDSKAVQDSENDNNINNELLVYFNSRFLCCYCYCNYYMYCIMIITYTTLKYTTLNSMNSETAS